MEDEIYQVSLPALWIHLKIGNTQNHIFIHAQASDIFPIEGKVTERGVSKETIY